MKHELSASLKFHSKAACMCAGQASAAFVLEFNRQTAKQSEPNFFSNFGRLSFRSKQSLQGLPCYGRASATPSSQGGPNIQQLGNWIGAPKTRGCGYPGAAFQPNGHQNPQKINP